MRKFAIALVVLFSFASLISHFSMSSHDVSASNIKNSAKGSLPPQSLVVANVGSGTVSVLKGKGDGTFAKLPDIPIGSGPTSLVVGNFTGHGNQDVAVAVSSGISILVGKGNGTFTSLPQIPLSGRPQYIVTSDFNRDGKQDLAVLGTSCHCVTILLGKGDGTFNVLPSFHVRGNPSGIVAGDFNAGAVPDLAVTNNGIDFVGVSILIGRGDGTFLLAHQYATQGDAFTITKGDFNGDNKQDLAVATTGNGIQILINNGNGSFTLLAPFTAGHSGAGTVALQPGDYNGDGKLDLANDDLAGQQTILLGNGDGTFSSLAQTGYGNSFTSIARGDFNGDGKKDLAVTDDYTSNDVLILLGNGDGTFAAQPVIPVGSSPNSIAVITFQVS